MNLSNSSHNAEHQNQITNPSVCLGGAETIPAEAATRANELMVKIASLENRLTGRDGAKIWTAKFSKRFHVGTPGDLPAEKYPDGVRWLENRLKELETKQRRRNALVSARDHRLPHYSDIKTKMRLLRRDSDQNTFYSEVAQRLGFEKPFTSLTMLSDHDLQKVAEFVSKLEH